MPISQSWAKENSNISPRNKTPHIHNKELMTAARGGVFGLTGMVCSRLLNLLIQVAIARLFGITFFGYYITGLMFCRTLQVIAGMGLHVGSVRFMVQSMEYGNRKGMFLVYRTSILVPLIAGSICGYLMYVLAPFVCATVFSEPNLCPVFQLFCGALPCYTVLCVLVELSRSFGTVRYSVLIEDILFPLLQLGILLFCFFSNTPLIAVVAFIIASVIGASCMVAIVYRQIKYHAFRETKKPESSHSFTFTTRELLIYSVPLMSAGILFMVGHNIDIFMLNILCLGESVGLYAAATRWTILLDTIPMPLIAIFRPLIAKAISINDREMLRTLLMASSRWIMYITLPLTACLLFASQPAMQLFLEEKPQETASILLWCLLAARIINPFGKGAGLVLTMGGMQYKEMFVLVCSVAINVILNTLLIPYYGVIGAAIATGAGFYAITILRVFFVRQKWGMSTVSKSIIIPAIALCIVILVRLLFNSSISNNLYLQTAGGVLSAIFVMSCCIYSFAQDPDDKNIVHLLPPSIQEKSKKILSLINRCFSKYST